MKWLSYYVCLVLTVGLFSAALAQQPLALPELQALELREPLEVLATTSIIGDVVAQVGGDAIALSPLMQPGQDPHSYEPAARDLAEVSGAALVFVNGWGLEQSLLPVLEAVATSASFVPISAGITPLSLQGHEASHDEAESHQDGADPHTWLEVANVKQWVHTTETVLSTLDPRNAETYHANAQSYLMDLDALEAYARSSFATIPQEKRKLVTNHDALGYLAKAYGFEVIGTVLPSQSTLAAPSASELAALTEVMTAQGVCTLFHDASARVRLAQTVAEELQSCDEVAVLPLYTGALGPEGSGAESYLDMMRWNIDTIVEGLR